MVPPPIPTIELKKPIEIPIRHWPALWGNSLKRAALPVLKSILSEAKVAMTPNKIVNHLPSTLVTIQLPAKTPRKIKPAQRLRREKSTFPFFLCERMELREVGIIVAREVAVAIDIAESAETPKLWKRKNKTGTITIPPPTPNSPASIPAKTPVVANARIVGVLLVINSMMLMA